MFEDALLESGGRMKTHRAATTLLSLLLQSALVVLLLLLPLVFTEALPAMQWMGHLQMPPAVAAAPAPPQRVMRVVSGGSSELTREGALREPREVPAEVRQIVDQGPPAIGAPHLAGIPGGVTGGGQDGVLTHILSATRPRPPEAAPPRPVVSVGVMQGLLIHQVVPLYPRAAVIARVQGSVVLRAWISREGHIQDLRVVSGAALLREAAVRAVSQWRYQPYRLNGQPVAVETQITVVFRLNE